jgi:hypothetical protein
MDDQRITSEANDEPTRRRDDYEERFPRRPSVRGPDYRRDREHLNLLSIFYFIFCGLECVGLLVLPLEATFFLTMFSSGSMGSGPGAPPPELGYVMAAICGFIFLLTLAAAICLGLTGYWLRKLKNRMFCFVIACIFCLSVPLGTILGIFTILVLQRESVKELFRYGGPPPGEGIVRDDDNPYGR